MSSGGVNVGARLVVGGGLRIDGFNFSGSVTFSASGSLFSASISNSFSLFGFRTVTMTGTIRSDGYVSLAGSVSFLVGNRTVLGADVSLSVGFSLSSGVADFSATASGTGYIAGWAAVTVSGSLNESGRLSLAFRAGSFGLGTYAWNLGSGGAVQAGPVSGATVFFDANGNLMPDNGEPISITDEFGYYTFEPEWFEPFDLNGNGVLDDSEGFIVAMGGIDITTGLPFVGILRTFATGHDTATPLTLSPLATVFTHLVATLGSRESANQALAEALGASLPPGIDFASFEPFDALLTGSADASRLYVGSVQLSSLVAGIHAYLSAAEPMIDAGALSSAVYSLLAAEIAGLRPGGSLDLSSQQTVLGIMGDVVEQLGIDLPLGASAAAEIMAEGAARLDAIAGSTDLDAIFRNKAAIQGPVADVLSGLGDGAITPAEAVAQATGDGYDELLAEVDPPGVPDDYERPPPPSIVFEDLPDGTVRVTVTAENSEPSLDENG
jgi:hypothetical protein